MREKDGMRERESITDIKAMSVANKYLSTSGNCSNEQSSEQSIIGRQTTSVCP